MEVHENPARALSDGPNAYRLGRLRALLRRVQRVRSAARQEARAATVPTTSRSRHSRA